MKFEGELTRRENRRRGPGWWMDVEGQWRAPEEWPEDEPPLEGWVRNPQGGWMAPVEPAETRWTRHTDTLVEPEPVLEAPRTESRQARADKRAMLIVTGALIGALLLLVGAMILISQAGAADEEEAATVTTDVIYAAETDEALRAEREEAARQRPATARTELAALRSAALPEDAPAFQHENWVLVEDGCVSRDEQVLVSRSRGPVSFVDDMECVLDGGQWPDRENGNTVRSVIDAEVVSFVPLEIVWASGGWNWTAETKAAFAGDVDHPAVWQVVAAGFGHNPREQGPADWKPAARSQWCAYAVDWITVKQRWNLSVTDDERATLASMLDTCDEAGSAGADPHTTATSPQRMPPIGLLRP